MNRSMSLVLRVQLINESILIDDNCCLSFVGGFFKALLLRGVGMLREESMASQIGQEDLILTVLTLRSLTLIHGRNLSS
jgi:hypothetical protein